MGNGQPTDQDLVRDHPFEPARFSDAWPGVCGHEVDGLPCGYSRAEHTDPGRSSAETMPEKPPERP